MQDFTLYNTNEIVALVIAVVMGTSAYIGVVYNKDKKKITWSFAVAVFVINLFFTWVASEWLRVLKWGAFRSAALPLVAFLGQFISDYISKNYPKIFDATLRKGGLNIDSSETNLETDNNTENEKN